MNIFKRKPKKSGFNVPSEHPPASPDEVSFMRRKQTEHAQGAIVMMMFRIAMLSTAATFLAPLAEAHFGSTGLVDLAAIALFLAILHSGIVRLGDVGSGDTAVDALLEKRHQEILRAGKIKTEVQQARAEFFAAKFAAKKASKGDTEEPKAQSDEHKRPGTGGYDVEELTADDLGSEAFSQLQRWIKARKSGQHSEKADARDALAHLVREDQQADAMEIAERQKSKAESDQDKLDL